MLEAENLGYSVNGKWLVREVSLQVGSGSFWAIVGANGSGKSTLLRMLGGEWTPRRGAVRLNGAALDSYSAQELARLRACLSQVRQANFPFTAYEIALMGRLPWQQGWGETEEDHAIVQAALVRTGADIFSARSYPTLSGGEQTRVDLARTLAQAPRLLLLDEPTNHLDVHHQLALMDVCRRHTEGGGMVVAVLHDLNLAARHADGIVMLHEGRLVACGAPEEVLTCEHLRRYFGLECEVWRHPTGCPWVVPTGYCEGHGAPQPEGEEVRSEEQRAAYAV